MQKGSKYRHTIESCINLRPPCPFGAPRPDWSSVNEPENLRAVCVQCVARLMAGDMPCPECRTAVDWDQLACADDLPTNTKLIPCKHPRPTVRQRYVPPDWVDLSDDRLAAYLQVAEIEASGLQRVPEHVLGPLVRDILSECAVGARPGPGDSRECGGPAQGADEELRRAIIASLEEAEAERDREQRRRQDEEDDLTRALSESRTAGAAGTRGPEARGTGGMTLEDAAAALGSEIIRFFRLAVRGGRHSPAACRRAGGEGGGSGGERIARGESRDTEERGRQGEVQPGAEGGSGEPGSGSAETSECSISAIHVDEVRGARTALQPSAVSRWGRDQGHRPCMKAAQCRDMPRPADVVRRGRLRPCAGASRRGRQRGGRAHVRSAQWGSQPRERGARRGEYPRRRCRRRQRRRRRGKAHGGRGTGALGDDVVRGGASRCERRGRERDEAEKRGF